MSRPKKGEEHPREEYKSKIKLMVAIGISQEQIAGLLRMSKDTLHRHYSHEMELGSAEANTVVGGKIFEAARKGESWACSLWAARRMGWKESSDVNLNGQVNAAVEVRIVYETRGD